ncbi:unnamed protein product, partial [Heterosigma akashiwo]
RTGRILKVVLTGGPVAGKTSAIKLLTSLLATDPTLQNPKVLAIPETATMLYEMGISRKDELGRGKTRQLLAFQQALFEIQISLENTAMKLARKWAHCAEDRSRDIIILMDRGLVDCKGYVPEQVREALLLNKNTSEDAILARYDMVIHLHSVAVEFPELYDDLMMNNSSRKETLEEARIQDEKELASWSAHPCHYEIKN